MGDFVATYALPLLLAFVAGGGFAAVAVKLLNRGNDKATERQTNALTAHSEVETIRQVLAEVRASDAAKTERVNALEGRIDRLERREYETLRLAAAHAVWDSMAYAALLTSNPEHPPPPPITLEKGDV